jgi:hypothetical protein
MANADHPYGLRSLGFTIEGGCPFVDEFTKLVGYGTAVFPGDAVNQVASGDIEVSATPGTDDYTGVALDYGAASTATTHRVIVSPGCLFTCQDNNDTDGFALADRGLNGNIELNAGDATKLLSGHELDESSLNTTVTLDLHCHDKLNVPDNAYGANCRVVVTFNKHRMAPDQVGV